VLDDVVIVGEATQAIASLRKVPILPPDAIRSIPFGSAVLLQSQSDPMPLRMRPWTARPDARTITEQAARVEAELLAAARQP